MFRHVSIGFIVRWLSSEFVRLPEKEFQQVAKAFKEATETREVMSLSRFSPGDDVEFISGTVTMRAKVVRVDRLARAALIELPGGQRRKYPPALLRKA